MLKIIRWVQEFDFRTLSHLDGSLTTLIRQWKLKNGQAVVITSRGWHRLRIIGRWGDRAVMIVPETSGCVLEDLAKWAAQSLRDGVTFMREYRLLEARAA